MKTTTLDKIAFTSVLAVALMTVGACAYSLALQRRAQHLVHTIYSHSTPEFRAAVAAAEDDDCEHLDVARGR